MYLRDLLIATSLLVAATATNAQTTTVPSPTPLAASAPTAVPALIPYSGIAENGAGKPLTGETLLTFSLFKDEQGGEALWTESQAVPIDVTGHYKVQLGASASAGLPLNTFASGEGRWLEVQIAGQKQQPRVLLMSVPYAMKAADAETLGGLPASAYLRAGSVEAVNALATPATVSPDAGATVTTPGGTTGFLPKFTGSAIIGNSLLSETGTSIGIGTTSPLATLDVNGTLAVRGEVGLIPEGTATTKKPFPSNPLDFIASAYSSTTRGAKLPEFQLQAEPTGNNTTAPSATLNLLYTDYNSGASTETGLSISSRGLLKFAPGQTFPGTGTGTITGVSAGTDLLGGGTTGDVTLNLDTTKVAQLLASNTFTGTQSIGYGDLALPTTQKVGTGAVTIGGVPFLHGYSAGSSNVFVGNAGNFTTGGVITTAVGFSALAQQTSGSENTAVGTSALTQTTTGIQNTSVGADTLTPNVTGSGNTALGFLARTSGPALNNTTTLGANATVSQNNSLVLGNTAAHKPGSEFVNVGIGTDTPSTVLEAAVSASGALGPVLTLSNPNGGGSSAAINFHTNNPVQTQLGFSSQVVAVNDGLAGDDLYFTSVNTSQANYPFLAQEQTNMVILSSGRVGIPFASGSDIGANVAAQLTVTGLSGREGPDGGRTPEPGSPALSGSGGYGLFAAGGDGGDFSGGSSNFLAGGIGTYGGSFVGGSVSTYIPESSPTSTTGDGIYAEPGQSTAQDILVGNAATLNGNVSVTGALTAATKDFKIDHPSDPANKYLYHASVESSEMMDIYSGNVTTDELGIAIVTLPAWFETLNTDFRYQLTTIGRDAHAWISQEVASGKFIISTNATRVKVSWQITAVRQDAYAKAHPLVVEQAKPASERGYYMHPELYGQQAERQTEWGRHPEQMRRMQVQKLQQKDGFHLGPSQQVGPPASAVNRNFTQHTASSMKPVASNTAPASVTKP